MNQHIEYSEARGTWNLFVDGEWYLEGTYEQCEAAMFNNACDEEEEYDDEPYGYESNCHCDTYGVCGGTSCPNYFTCHQ